VRDLIKLANPIEDGCFKEIWITIALLAQESLEILFILIT
jgi:hypothetical protein